MSWFRKALRRSLSSVNPQYGSRSRGVGVRGFTGCPQTVPARNDYRVGRWGAMSMDRRHSIAVVVWHKYNVCVNHAHKRWVTLQRPPRTRPSEG